MRTPGICVYGGSSNAVDQKYLDAAFEIGAGIASRGWMLVNGAGDTGMMGAATRGCLSKNGQTIGIAPYFSSSPAFFLKKARIPSLRARCVSARRSWNRCRPPLSLRQAASARSKNF
ncbi:LOG family protein [Allobaculum sp. Allo2]|uniref:LOG family protein n=1 Tax=Allobaculum sp. Allo2 TaxID=2853432 RepID=UPI0034635C0D|nr:hypothetical protein KWG61_03975 [Allobaculum sp. Allo2]